jgi:YD repeat-containing protein
MAKLLLFIFIIFSVVEGFVLGLFARYVAKIEGVTFKNSAWISGVSNIGSLLLANLINGHFLPLFLKEGDYFILSFIVIFPVIAFFSAKYFWECSFQDALKGSSIIVVLTLILFFLYKFYPDAADKKNTLKEMNLNGKVQSVKLLEYGTDDKLELGDLTSEKNIMFNDKGNVIEEKDKYSSTIYRYDDKDNLIEEELKFSMSDTFFIRRYVHDENGQPVECKTYMYPINKMDGMERYEYKYDEKGNISETIIYDKDGKIQTKAILNESGKIISGNFWGMKFSYEYDEKGNEIERKSVYATNDENVYSYKYIDFDKNGNWTKRIVSSNNFDFETKEIENEKKIELREIKYF